MPDDLAKKQWTIIAVTTPFVAAMFYLAIGLTDSSEPPLPDTRVVSFRVYFDNRVRFPETIRQSTIKMLFGPGFEIVEGDFDPTEQPTTERDPSAERDPDCKIHNQGDLLTLRIPQSAATNDVAAKLRKLARIKAIEVQMK